jgi:hypothetical protein
MGGRKSFVATAIANGDEASKAFVTRPMAGQGSRDSVINTFLLEDGARSSRHQPVPCSSNSLGLTILLGMRQRRTAGLPLASEVSVCA